MVVEGETLLILALFGGLVAIDGTSVGQFMISRPMVAASLAGWIAGEPLQGAQIGLVLEAFHLAVLPVGAAKYPEGGPAAVAAGAAYAWAGAGAASLLLIVLGALLLEWLGGESVRSLRQINVRVMRAPPDEAMHPTALERRHATVIGLDYLRGVGIVVVGTVALTAFGTYLAPYWALGDRVAEVILVAAVTGMVAGAIRVTGSRAWLAAAGAAAGGLLILLTS